MSSCIVNTDTIAMINGRNARNEPNTQASTSSAASAPINSSVSTLELPLEALPEANAVLPVACTVAVGSADLAAPASWSSTCGGTSVLAFGGNTIKIVLRPPLLTNDWLPVDA